MDVFVVTVVDALRLVTEFGCGDYLVKEDLDEEDIENLLIQQIEFCNIIVINKVAEVKPEELNKVKAIIRQLQPTAKIIETNFGKVDVKEIIDTNNFDFEKVASSAGWIKELEREKKDLIDENIRLKQEVRNARTKLDVLRNAAPTEVSNADLLRRLSNLEKIIYGEVSK